MNELEETARQLKSVLDEIEIDKIIEGLKANCQACPTMNSDDCIVCQEFKFIKNEK